MHEYLKSTLLCQLTRALEFAQQLSAYSSTSLVSVPLYTVRSWKRGSPPAIAGAESQMPIIRLTIDSKGLREIERLPRRPPFRSWRSDSLAFAVLEHREDSISEFKEITADFKVLRILFTKVSGDYC